MADDQEKTEAATPRKRDEAYRKGNIAKSREVNAALVLVAGTLFLLEFGPAAVARIRDVAVTMLGELPGERFSSLSSVVYLRSILLDSARIMAPIVVGVLLISIAAQTFQNGGLHFHVERMALKADAFSPLKGLKKIFSLRSVVQLGVSLAKVGVIATVLYLVVRSYIPTLVELSDRGAISGLGDVLKMAVMMMLYVALIQMLIGAVDYFYQRWQHERDLKMSKQEVKEERKSEEGNPNVKGRLRSLQRNFAQARMMQAVPGADVVVANPTHFSVVLKYERTRMAAPRMVAKGRDLVALHIREVARRHRVPIVEDPPLARALWRDVEIGDQIPPRFYRAVAAVLAYVMRKRRIMATA